MRTEADQHDANDGFQRSRQMFRNRVTKKDRCAGEEDGAAHHFFGSLASMNLTTLSRYSAGM